MSDNQEVALSHDEKVAKMKQDMKDLAEEQQRLESIISEKTRYLQSTPVGLTGSLIDSEGFPRADLDHYSIREARNLLACTKTDLAAVQKDIFTRLQELHEATQDDNAGKLGSGDDADSLEKKALQEAADRQAKKQQAPPREPFLIVQEVAAKSPSAEAGLQVGDLVCRIGPLVAEGFNSLLDLGQLIMDNEDCLLLVDVWRNKEIMQLTLVPHQWSGTGLLGCTMVAVS